MIFGFVHFSQAGLVITIKTAMVIMLSNIPKASAERFQIILLSVAYFKPQHTHTHTHTCKHTHTVCGNVEQPPLLTHTYQWILSSPGFPSPCGRQKRPDLCSDLPHLFVIVAVYEMRFECLPPLAIATLLPSPF